MFTSANFDGITRAPFSNWNIDFIFSYTRLILYILLLPSHFPHRYFTVQCLCDSHIFCIGSTHIIFQLIILKFPEAIVLLECIEVSQQFLKPIREREKAEKKKCLYEFSERNVNTYIETTLIVKFKYNF